MNWESILKRNTCLEGVARELAELNVRFYPGLEAMGKIPGYESAIRSGKWGEQQLLNEIESSIYEIHKWYEKGRIDKDRREELLDKYEKVRQSLKNCKDVKEWDEG